MSTINWANDVSGLFSTAADWSGGAVPGAGDTAIISAGGAAPYTVTVSSAVELGGLQLDQALATLSVHSKLTSPAILVEAGTLTLAKGTLLGTVTQTGGTFQVSSSGGTLNAVTWQGALDPGFPAAHRQQPGTLTIAKSLTLEGAGGAGPGIATFDGAVILDGLKTLNSATINGDGTMTVVNSAKLTLGSALVDNLSLSFATSAQEALINDGVIASSGSAVLMISDTGSTLGTVTNDGTMSGNITVSVATFTNDGLISATAGQTIELDAGTITRPGANGDISLASANLILGGALTTKSLTSFYATQHVSGSGSFGFGVSGTLTNKGHTLDIGKGSIFGTLDGSAAGTLTGGTVVDTGGDSTLTGGGYVYPNFLAFTLADLTYESASATLTLANNWALTNVTLTGVSTLQGVSADAGFAAELLLTGDTLSGVGTLDVGGQLVMDSTSAGDASGSLALNLTSDANDATFGADQSLSGFTIDVASGLITLEEKSISGVSFDFQQPVYQGELLIQSATGTETWESSVTASIAGTSTLSLASGTGTLFNDGLISASGYLYLGDFENYTNGNLNNSGVIDISGGGLVVLAGSGLVNSGTIAVSGGLLSLQAGAFRNTGVVSVTDGTLAVAGTLSNAQLSGLLAEVSLSNSSLDLQASLNLQGGTLSAGQNGIPASLMLDGESSGVLTDGTLLVHSGQTVDLLNHDELQVAVVNDGTLDLTTGDYTVYGYFQDAVTGSGAIDVARDASIFRDVWFNAAVGAGQTVNLMGSGLSAAIVFENASASTSFAGTLNGFSVGDNLTLEGETVSSAAFKGASIVATLSTGTTISFATSSALTGKVEILYGNEIVYQSAPSVQDWSAHQSIENVPRSSLVESRHVASGALPHGDLWAGDMLLPMHDR